MVRRTPILRSNACSGSQLPVDSAQGEQTTAQSIGKGPFRQLGTFGIHTLATRTPKSVNVNSSLLRDISGSNNLAPPDCLAGLDPERGAKTFYQLFNPAAFAMPAKGT